MAYESHSLDLFGLYARNLGGNRGEVPVGIVWILGADAMSRKLSSLAVAHRVLVVTYGI